MPAPEIEEERRRTRIESAIDTVDPSRKIRRPPKRKPDVYRPSLSELETLRNAAVGYERFPILW